MKSPRKGEEKIVLPQRTATMFQEIEEVWLSPIQKTKSVFKDLPRLASRIEVLCGVSSPDASGSTTTTSPSSPSSSSSSSSSASSSSSEPPVSPRNADNKAREAMKRVIIDVSRFVEDAATYERIKDQIMASSGIGVDLQLETADIFNQIIGVDSKTARVFKAITQNILFAGVFELKVKLPLKVMTRDVPGHEGWRVLIEITKDTVCVSHYKREQTLATTPPADLFWYEWRLSMMFSRDMRELISTSLKITNVGFMDTTSEAKKHEINSLLCSGNVLIS
eukprot:TRINITY_DN286_c2_g1_i2.p1 TRINITY_DN286_c2_g1~~TRINITY_DN286_c2_g1_i2.p1  ORF type:complete len:279 (-),score=73.04 TRINITY_DN286_c2_g1_i2:96-932(-)